MMPDRFEVTVGDATVTALHYPAAEPSAGATLVLGHGAGADQLNAFLVDLAATLASRGIDAITFNFAYAERKKRRPDPTARLEACYRAVVGAARARRPSSRLFVGGKSMGGRIASHLAAVDEVDGLVCLGYPLHPPGNPEKLRVAHLAEIRCPVLVVQGSGDPFGSPEELRPWLEPLGTRATLEVVLGGDHSFTVRDRAARAAVLASVHETVATWVRRHVEG